LVALAVSYHLARPGAEIDPETLSEYRHGLAEVLPEIEAQIEADAVALELNPLRDGAAFDGIFICDQRTQDVLDARHDGGGEQPAALDRNRLR
jgi:hypothetical protein